MASKQDAFYYDNFITCAGYSCRAAHLLKEILMDYKPDEIGDRFNEIHEIERQADEERHKLNDMLLKAFITPIEREDIAQLSHDIDEVSDKIEDVLIRVYINNIQKIRPEALKLLDTVIKCCDALHELMREFYDFRKSKKLSEKIIAINTLEEEADRLYIDSMRRLHTEEKDVLQIIAWREIYDYMEKCADACEHAGDVVGSVVMKNS